MLVRTLRSLRLGLRGTALGTLLRRMGIVTLGRMIYDRRLLRRGSHEADLLGTRLRFVISGPGEITRIDSLAGEEAFVGRLIDAVRPGDVVYDVGANIGVISLLIAARYRDAGVTVHAFEPEPANVHRLRQNAEMNKLERVIVHDCALGASTGMVKLFLDGEVSSGGHSLLSGHTKAAESVEIRMTTASCIARDFQAPPNVVKIDVEGAEMEVLRGMGDLFDAGHVRDLFVEVHPESLTHAGSSPEALRRWLEDRRCRLVWSCECGSRIHQHFHRGEMA